MADMVARIIYRLYTALKPAEWEAGAPNSPAALRRDCHSGYRDAAFMAIMRWAFYSRLKEEHPDVGAAYGYIY
ncbi:MAG: hypothetical protein LBU32_06140 [Clostridiales bacterium]|jgi:hypothetical protein|nr:hypothetical protein [Clostridiales bacterium]